MTTWRELLSQAAETLVDRMQAIWIIQQVAQDSGGAAASNFGEQQFVLMGHLDDEVDLPSVEKVHTFVKRRISGEPLQHVLGHWSFRNLDLIVDKRALVPRPETEIVTGQALWEIELLRQRRTKLEAIKSIGNDKDQVIGMKALDLGTGGGAIACSLVAEDENLQVIGVDLSAGALELARANRGRLSLSDRTRLFLRQGSWYEPVKGEVFDCIVSNPPYLADHEIADLDPIVRDFDPSQALFSGPTGLEAISAVVAGAPDHLTRPGSLIVEIAPHQAQKARELAIGARATSVEIVKDLATRERVLVARW